jgi:hypothetical protein
LFFEIAWCQLSQFSHASKVLTLGTSGIILCVLFDVMLSV